MLPSSASLRSLMVAALFLLPTVAAAQSIAAHAPGASAPVVSDGARSAPSAEIWDTLTALRAQGKFQAALDRLDVLARRSPGHVGVLWRQALLYIDRGQFAPDSDAAIPFYRQAIAHADAALAADSTSAWAHLMKAMAEGRMSLHEGNRQRVRRSRAVKQHAERALALDSTLATAYHVRGRWYRNVADLNFIERAIVKTIYGGLPAATFEASARDLERATALESRSYHHLELAKTYLAMDRDAAAKRHLQAALTAAPSPLDPKYKPEAREMLREME